VAVKISFMDLKSQYEQMSDKIQDGIGKVLQHGQYIMGPEVHRLEKELADLAGVSHVLSCSSGTDALLMPLMAYGVGPGDAVFTTPFTFIATAEVIALLGATPVLVDINPATFNLDPARLEEAIEAVTKAGKLRPRGIIPVDLFGQIADYSTIEALAARHGLFVIQDAAQSLGARSGDRRAGSFGDVAGTSFYPAKPLGCYGDGGAIFTNNDELAEKLASIRDHGKGRDKYDNVRVGLNGRLDSIQAAILLVKLASFEEELKARQRVADRYTANLKGVVTPHVPEGHRSAWALYSILSEKRDALKLFLAERGIPTVIYYERCLHQQTVFAGLGYKAGDFPVAESAAARILSLPMHPFLADDEVDAVLAAFAEWVE